MESVRKIRLDVRYTDGEQTFAVVVVPSSQEVDEITITLNDFPAVVIEKTGKPKDINHEWVDDWFEIFQNEGVIIC